MQLCAVLVVALLGQIPAAWAGGGHYDFDGGTSRQRAQVRHALEASAFDWDVVPATITIHIAPGQDSEARRGEIWLDANLLDTGSFSWGVVQHEYAHQVDFFLLGDAERALLLQVLGGDDWCDSGSAVRHSRRGCERFASTLAWAYWPSPQNCMQPTGAPDDESAAMAPAAFRALLSRLLGVEAVPLTRLEGAATAQRWSPQRRRAAGR